MSIFISDHALPYIAHGRLTRTGLTAQDIGQLIDSGSYVDLGQEGEDKSRYYLVWDHHRGKAVVLLAAPGRQHGETKLVSVWEVHFSMLGSFVPSPFELERAREKSEILRSRAEA